jgi:hypothetical protein
MVGLSEKPHTITEKPKEKASGFRIKHFQCIIQECFSFGETMDSKKASYPKDTTDVELRST